MSVTCHTRIILMRHGTPIKKKNESGQDVLYGPDANLSAKGRDESILTAAKLPSIDLIYSSSLRRAYDTAGAVAYAKGLKTEDIVKVEELQDIAFPSGVGQPIDKVVRGEIPIGENDETTEMMAARVIPAFKQILSESYGKTRLVVAHGHVIRLIILQYIDGIMEIPQSLDSYATTNYLNPGEAWILEFDENNTIIKNSCRMVTHPWNETPGFRRF